MPGKCLHNATRAVPVSLPVTFVIVMSAAQGILHRNLGRNRQGLVLGLVPSACRDGHGSRNSRKQPGFGAGIVPMAPQKSSCDTRNTKGFAVGISRALPRIFPLLVDFI